MAGWNLGAHDDMVIALALSVQATKEYRDNIVILDVTHGVNGWGGLMRDRIEAVIGVESLVDALRKFNPNVRQDDPYGRGAKAVAVGGALLTEARKKLKEAEKETRQAEEEVASAEEQEASVEPPAIDGTPPVEPEMPMEPVDDSQSLLDSIKPEDYGGPREEAGVRGMKNELSTSAPAETDGSEATPPPNAELPPTKITKTWFVDNFGMSSAKISEILEKG